MVGRILRGLISGFVLNLVFFSVSDSFGGFEFFIYFDLTGFKRGFELLRLRE